jgi:hypothetical protein
MTPRRSSTRERTVARGRTTPASGPLVPSRTKGRREKAKLKEFRDNLETRPSVTDLTARNSLF